MSGDTCYIAGPMRGIKAFNFPAFFAAEHFLIEHGWNVINPARRDVEQYRNLDWDLMTGHENLDEIGFDLRATMQWDLRQIATKADTLVLLPGWEESKGARAERALAEALGLEIRVFPDFLFDPHGTPTVTGGHKVWAGVPVIVESLAFRMDLVAEVTVDSLLGLTMYATGETDHFGNIEVLHFLADGEGPVTWYFMPESLLRADTLDELAAVRQDPVVHQSDARAEEVRVRSETGGEKGRKLAELGSLDPRALLVLSEVSGFGARKYEAHNFLRGYDWSLSFNAMQRHALAFWDGEDIDPESGQPHIAHAAWHALALTSFLVRGLGTDDRYRQSDVTREEAA